MASSLLLSSRRLLPELLHTPTPNLHPMRHRRCHQPPSLLPLAQPLLLRGGPGSPRQHAVDIGAWARQLQSHHLWTYAVTFGCAAGFMVNVLATFHDQLVFYLTPTDALARFAADPSKTCCQLSGLILEGSITHPSSSLAEIEFAITDVLIHYEGAPPDLFREGHSVIVEGFLKPLADDLLSDGAGRKVSEKARDINCFLCGTVVLAKHYEKYMPKEVGEAIERNKKHIEAEAATAAKETTAVAVDAIKASS